MRWRAAQRSRQYLPRPRHVTRPTTDVVVDFEDLVMFALNYTPNVSLATKGGPVATAAAIDAISIEAPELVKAGELIEVPVTLSGSGDLQAVSLSLAWDHAVVEAVDVAGGEFIRSQGGVVLSSGAGRADAALLGVGSHGLRGEGTMATARFRALKDGEARITVAKAVGRDKANHAVTIATQNPLTVASVVTATELFPVIPNPTSGESQVNFALAKRGNVDLSVYSVEGRRVKTLVRGVQEVGRYHYTWDGSDERGSVAKSGIYFIQLEAAGAKKTRVLTLLR